MEAHDYVLWKNRCVCLRSAAAETRECQDLRWHGKKEEVEERQRWH